MTVMRYFYLFILIPIIISCDSRSYFTFKNQYEVDSFPDIIIPHDPDTLDIEAIGIQGIKVFDDFILLSDINEEGVLSLYDKSEGTLIGTFLRRGNGPYEIVYQPFISWLSFYCEESESIGLYDFKGTYMQRSIVPDNGSWQVLSDSLDISGGARYFRIDDDRLFCRKINASHDGYERHLFDTKERRYFCSESMRHLNQFSSSDMNNLATMFLYNEQNNVVVELGSRINVIHIYSIDEASELTLTIGKLQPIDQIEALPDSEMPKSYYDGKTYQEFFAGLYIGTTMEKLNTGQYPFPHIHIFDYEGNPKADIQLSVRTQFFDIDVHDNKLYVVDAESEKVLRYDMKGII